MIYRRLIIVILSITLFFSCGTAPKKGVSEADMNALGERLEERAFEIVADWAFPLMTQGITQVANSGLLLPGSSANRIDLMGNSNYFRAAGDSVYINLPYFGERQIGGGYGNSDVGIKFEGVPLSYVLIKEAEKGYCRIDIRVKDEIETLAFNLFLFTSGKADINVNSSHRSSIRYSGSLSFPPETD